MLRSETLGAAVFFEKILNELYQSVYLALGGSIDDQSFDWATRGLSLAGIGIKILILLSFIGFWYWLIVYVVKHLKRRLHLTDGRVRTIRSVLRYLWIIVSILAIMSQVGVAGETIKAFAKASVWAGIFYMLLSLNTQMVHWLIGQYDINESIEQLIRNLMLVLILVLASGVILAQFGVNIVSLVAGLGIVGLAVGFAAQNTLANFIAGIAILVEQSFRVGDWIRIGTQEGRVVQITLRTTHILDRDNIIIVIPNATVASSEVVNLTSKTFIRFDVFVRVPLNSDIDKVRLVVLGVLKQNDSLLSHPLPSVTLSKIDEYDLKFIVRFWVSPAAVARLPILKENLLEGIKKELDKNGIPTPFPHMQLVPPKGGAEVFFERLPNDNDPQPPPKPQKPKADPIYQNSGTNNAQSFPDGS